MIKKAHVRQHLQNKWTPENIFNIHAQAGYFPYRLLHDDKNHWGVSLMSVGLIAFFSAVVYYFWEKNKIRSQSSKKKNKNLIINTCLWISIWGGTFLHEINYAPEQVNPPPPKVFTQTLRLCVGGRRYYMLCKIT